MSQVIVQVPATSANLGPGYDCLGVALQIYNRVTIGKSDAPPEDAMAAAAGEAFFTSAKLPPFPFAWRIEGDVPQSRGLGSSVTVRLGILHGLNTLVGQPLTPHQLFTICARLEGHPDNAAPAAFGGFTVARSDSEFTRFEVLQSLQFVLLIPDFELRTSDARRVLPATVPHRDAVRSLAAACEITAAFASQDYARLAGSFADYLHQPYREPLIPMLTRVLDAGSKAGALGGYLSGSGSTIACVTLENANAVADAMLAGAAPASALTVVTTADNSGARVIP